jgi:tetratricopeptide (TPR) repeat protein
LNGSCFALEHAVDSFRAAVRADAGDARAHAGLALARCAQAQHLADAPRRAYADATHAALRALALDPSDASVQVALATLLFLREWDWVSAERAVQRALENDAEHVDAYLLHGNLLEARAHLDDGLAMKMRALEHAPTSPHVLTDIAVSFWRRRDYMNTIAWSERALAHDSVHVRARMYLAFALWKVERYDAVTNELLRQADAFGIARETLINAAGASSQTAESARWPSPLARVVMARLPIAAGGPSAANAAIASGEQGHIDTAFRQLDVVIAQRQGCVVSLDVDPQWDRMRGDPRFGDLLKYIGLR